MSCCNFVIVVLTTYCDAKHGKVVITFLCIPLCRKMRNSITETSCHGGVSIWEDEPANIKLTNGCRSYTTSYTLTLVTGSRVTMSGANSPCAEPPDMLLSTWRHQMEKISALLALREGITDGFPHKGPETRALMFYLMLVKEIWC